MITRPNPENDASKEAPGISYFKNEISKLKNVITNIVAQNQTITKKNSDINKTLFAISNATNTTSNLDELFESIHSSLGQIMELPNFYIALYHKEKDCITIPYYKDSKHENWESMVIENVSTTKKPSSTGCVILSGAPLLYNRYNYTQVCQQLNMNVIGELSEVWMGAPLKIDNEVIGVIVAQSYTHPDLYDENDLEIFTSVSNQVALAIERKRVEEALKQSESVTRTLFAISNAVNSSQTLSDLYQKIHFSLSTIIDVTNFAIAIYDNQKDILSFPYMVDEKDERHPDIENAVQSGVLNAEVIRSKKPRFLNKKDITKRQIMGAKKVGTNPEQWLGIPLIAKNNVIGVLVVQSYSDPHLYNEQDVNLLVSISNQMAIAIDRKRTENELIKSEKKYRSMMESMTDPVYICSPDKKIEYMNPQMIERLGQDRTGEPCNKALHGLNHQCEDCDFEMGSHRQIIEATVVSPLDDRQYRVTKMPIVNADETISKMCIYRDITKYVKAVAEKEKTQKKLIQAQKMEAIGTLAGGVAHDLNNILSGIVTLPQLLLERLPDESPLRPQLHTIEKSGAKAAMIVQDMLTLSRSGINVAEVVDLTEVINGYLESPECLQLKKSHPLVNITTSIATSECHITGSPVHLDKMLMNLVNNSAEAIRGSGDVVIGLANISSSVAFGGYNVIPPGEYVYLSVSDTGSGITKEDQLHIFEPFFTKKVLGRKGTGLGMVIVWNTVKDHNGFIQVHSDMGHGTTMHIYFPLTKEKTGEQNMAETPEQTLAGNNEKILVVDDVEMQREIAVMVLNGLGYDATALSSGLEAIEYVKHKKVDLVITDMIMDPGISGLETAKEILTIDPQIKIILVSGYSEKGMAQQALDHGAMKFIQKPYSITILGTAVREILESG